MANEGLLTGQIITTSAEVTLNGGLIRELPQNPRKIQELYENLPGFFSESRNPLLNMKGNPGGHYYWEGGQPKVYTQNPEIIFFLEPVNVLYFGVWTLQKKAQIPFKTRGPIWVPGLYTLKCELPSPGFIFNVGILINLHFPLLYNSWGFSWIPCYFPHVGSTSRTCVILYRNDPRWLASPSFVILWEVPKGQINPPSDVAISFMFHICIITLAGF